MEKENTSVEDIIASAQASMTDFPVNGRFLITTMVEKIARNDKPYFNLNLKDKTGSLSAKRFTRGEAEFESLKSIYLEGNIVEIEGVYQYDWDSVKINNERLLESYEVEPNEFEEPSDINLDELIATLMDTIESIQNQHLKQLLLLIFDDDEIREAYITCPASIGMHHSYKHGNIEHTVSMIKIFRTLEKNYGNAYALDSDLIYAGIILHDIGKIKEYSINNGIPQRNHGHGLIGHFSLGEQIVMEYIKQIDYFPEELAWKLRHLILSHHGRKEYGSPVGPQIPEAVILHLIDSLDAKFKEINFLNN